MPRSPIGSPIWTSQFLWVTPRPSCGMARRSSVFGAEHDQSLSETHDNSPREHWSTLLVSHKEAGTANGRIKELFKNAGARLEILQVSVELVSGISEVGTLSSLCFQNSSVSLSFSFPT